MTIKEKTPDKLLVNVNSFKMAVLDNQRIKETKADYENSRNMFWTLLGAFISCILSLVPSLNIWDAWLIIVTLVISISFGVGTLWFFLKTNLTKKSLNNVKLNNLENEIIYDAKNEILYTALIIICYQDLNSGEVKFMTENKGNFLIHCSMDPELSADNQKNLIINYLATTYNVQKKHVENITPLSKEPFFSIKPIHGETKQNGFIFFQVKLKKAQKDKLIKHSDVSWISIREMEGKPDLMGRNQDIIIALNENKTKIADSFGDSYGPLHIIWNITNQCPYNCAICATRDDTRTELSTDDKLRVLNNIFSVKEKINTLDFAGGEPIYKKEIRTIIIQAINSLGEDHISVTITGKGIEAVSNMPEDEMSKLLGKCEITLDASHENLSKIIQNSSCQSLFSRNMPEYSNINYMRIQDVTENLRTLVINIPLLDDDLNDDEIEILVSQILKLKKDYPEMRIEAQIIRLMPVGAFNDKIINIEKYKKYNPLEIAKKLYNRIEMTGIACRYHCSLRILSKLEPCEMHCNMLEKKIGVDCAGNVFACTWGAYLKLPDNHDITQNPFYLGNLVSTSLKSILEGQGTKTKAYKRLSKDITKRTTKHYCEAVSWFFHGEIDNKGDPLSN